MTLTGKLFRDAVISGANNIANNRAAVDELNVFPVPDGDTGTNMSMTIGNALPELKADRKSTRLNSSHRHTSRMPSSA